MFTFLIMEGINKMVTFFNTLPNDLDNYMNKRTRCADISGLTRIKSKICNEY